MKFSWFIALRYLKPKGTFVSVITLISVAGVALGVGVLLVVIGIIGLLVGLLLPALGKVIQRSKSTATMGTAQEFAKACDAYFQEFGEYPAAVPDEALYAGLNGDSDLPQITAAENALLARELRMTLQALLPAAGGSSVDDDLEALFKGLPT